MAEATVGVCLEQLLMIRYKFTKKVKTLVNQMYLGGFVVKTQHKLKISGIKLLMVFWQNFILLKT